jgi:hypothetical protein
VSLKLFSSWEKGTGKADRDSEWEENWADVSNGMTKSFLYALGVYFLLLPVFLLVAWRNEYTREILLSGWTPVLMAMLIRSVFLAQCPATF